MTYQKLRCTLRAVLSGADGVAGIAGIADAAYEADEILRLTAHADRQFLTLHGGDEIGELSADRCLSIARGRAAGEPLAYLIGLSPFFGEDYRISAGCLVPRADTEVLVEEAIARIPQGGVLWDLCTGCGCIPCAVLLNRPDIPYAAGLELYEIPLGLERENAEKFGLENRFHPAKCDVLRGEIPADAPTPSVMTANPPYISTDACRTLDEQVKKEPYTALCGGEDGLVFYRAILSAYRQYLPAGGYFLFEIGYDQGDALRALAGEHGMPCEIRKDYEGRDRAAILKKERN